MMFTQTKLTRILSCICMIAVLFPTISGLMIFQPKPAQAMGIGVPGDSSWSYNEVMGNLKDFVLDKAAVAIANQILQRMTASIVNWINSGFEGSPGFLTNPEGFFLDVADQITGELLQGTLLSQLCSPFSFDLRLNLALNQAGLNASRRYTCTLGKIIENSRNAVETAGQNSGINLYADEDGATIGNFIDGDFSQGGWAAFMAYTVEEQNNPIGAYLMSKSDVQASIDAKKASVNTDLNRGAGFLSWSKCDNVTAQITGTERSPEGLSLNDVEKLKNGPANSSVDMRELNTSTGFFKKTTDPKTNEIKYERCQTQTPGSLIGGSLQRQLNVPTDKLVLVKTISDSINAMLGALVNQMLTKGLASLSNPGSGIRGSNKSYLSQLAAEAAKKEQPGMIKKMNSIVNISKKTLAKYDDSINLLIVTRGNFALAKSCFEGKQNIVGLDSSEQTYVHSQISEIDTIVANQIESHITEIMTKKNTLQNTLNEFEQAYASSTNEADDFVPDFTGDYIDQKFARLNALVSKSENATSVNLDSAADAEELYKTIQAQTKELDKKALEYKTNCNAFPTSIKY